jgi:hypothetical protein
MTTKTNVTKGDAEKVLAAVRKQYAAYLDGVEGPVLLKDWNWTGYGAARWSVVWEGGPYEWAVNFGDSGVDEELAELAAEFGLSPVRFKPYPIPDTVWTEPVTGWALAIYPKETR